MNAIIKKYKACVDNNNKSGRELQTFEFYDVMENISRKERNCTKPFTVSSNLQKKAKVGTLISATNNSSSNQSSTQSSNQSSTRPIKSTFEERKETSPTPTSNNYQIRPSNPENGLKAVKSPSYPKGTGSTNARTRNELEKQWLEHLKKSEEQPIKMEERSQKHFQLKTEENKLKEEYMAIRREESDRKNALALKKLKAKQARHDQRMKIEKMKCKYLALLVKDQETIEDDDSD